MDPDELEIAAAVRMSMSIPIFFDPVVYNGPPQPRRAALIVDGGLLSNFPVWLFDSPPGQVRGGRRSACCWSRPTSRTPLVPGARAARRPEGKVSILASCWRSATR